MWPNVQKRCALLWDRFLVTSFFFVRLLVFWDMVDFVNGRFWWRVNQLHENRSYTKLTTSQKLKVAHKKTLELKIRFRALSIFLGAPYWRLILMLVEFPILEIMWGNEATSKSTLVNLFLFKIFLDFLRLPHLHNTNCVVGEDRSRFLWHAVCL